MSTFSSATKMSPRHSVSFDGPAFFNCERCGERRHSGQFTRNSEGDRNPVCCLCAPVVILPVEDDEPRTFRPTLVLRRGPVNADRKWFQDPITSGRYSQ